LNSRQRAMIDQVDAGIDQILGKRVPPDMRDQAL
jgi:hypothetical protein